MRFSIILFLFLFYSCSDNDNDCNVHFLVTESSEKEARYKCEGLANSHPKFEVISRISLGCITKDELATARKNTTSKNREICPGVSYTIRTRIE